MIAIIPEPVIGIPGTLIGIVRNPQSISKFPIHPTYQDFHQQERAEGQRHSSTNSNEVWTALDCAQDNCAQDTALKTLSLKTLG